MDWSLVLISQGIESVMDRSPEGGWGLLVDSGQFATALGVLRIYQLENRVTHDSREVIWPKPRFDWVCVPWAMTMCLFYWLEQTRPLWRDAGVLTPAVIQHGEIWRLFTAMFLHADLAHLAGNLSIGIVLLGLVMGRYGTGIGLLGAFLAGAAGNEASTLLHPAPFQGLGASGMVMGALGLLAAPALTHNYAWREHLVGLAAGAMLFVLEGLAPGTDIAAHFGGFGAGIILGMVGIITPKILFSNPLTNWTAGMLALALILLPWWLAMR